MKCYVKTLTISHGDRIIYNARSRFTAKDAARPQNFHFRTTFDAVDRNVDNLHCAGNMPAPDSIVFVEISYKEMRPVWNFWKRG